MQYVPKDIPEGINVQRGHPLKDFVKLLTICLIGFVVIYGILGLVSDQLSQRITYQQEVEYFGRFDRMKRKLETNKALRSEKLDELVKSLWAHYPESKDAPLDTYILREKGLNAFMALGGRLMVTEGALEELKNENELAFVICHELGHFYGRHVIKAMGRSLSLTVLSSLMGIQETSAKFINSATEFGDLSFSRKQETEADLFAMDCLNQHYGHVAGYDEFFKQVKKGEFSLQNSKLMKYSSTHPVTQDRLDKLDEFIKKNEFVTQGDLKKHDINAL